MLSVTSEIAAQQPSNPSSPRTSRKFVVLVASALFLCVSGITFAYFLFDPFDSKLASGKVLGKEPSQTISGNAASNIMNTFTNATGILSRLKSHAVASPLKAAIAITVAVAVLVGIIVAITLLSAGSEKVDDLITSDGKADVGSKTKTDETESGLREEDSEMSSSTKVWIGVGSTLATILLITCVAAVCYFKCPKVFSFQKSGNSNPETDIPTVVDGRGLIGSNKLHVEMKPFDEKTTADDKAPKVAKLFAKHEAPGAHKEISNEIPVIEKKINDVAPVARNEISDEIPVDEKKINDVAPVAHKEISNETPVDDKKPTNDATPVDDSAFVDVRKLLINRVQVFTDKKSNFRLKFEDCNDGIKVSIFDKENAPVRDGALFKLVPKTTDSPFDNLQKSYGTCCKTCMYGDLEQSACLKGYNIPKKMTFNLHVEASRNRGNVQYSLHPEPVEFEFVDENGNNLCQ